MSHAVPNIYSLALERYGPSTQIDVMIEECAELIKALCKWKRQMPGTERHKALQNIQEEMADVTIMLEQMKYIFGDPAEAISVKLKRLDERLKQGGEH